MMKDKAVPAGGSDGGVRVLERFPRMRADGVAKPASLGESEMDSLVEGLFLSLAQEPMPPAIAGLAEELADAVQERHSAWASPTVAAQRKPG